MRGICVVVSMSLLLGVCISQAGSRRAWEQENTLKPRPKQQITADETNAVKDGPSRERVLFGQQHMSTPCDLPGTSGGARIVALAPNPPAYRVHRLDSITLSRAELPALSMRNAPREAPRDAPVTISGKSPISVYGMSAPVKVSTTHARLTVSDTTGDVEAAIKPDSGIIDFFGDRGHVHLNADWELNLVISAQQFTGDLEGTARGRIHVLLQPGFISPSRR